MTVISACGYTGRVKLGIEYFESMVSDFGLEPRPEHYSCVVNLLCRAGELEKAWKMVNEMTPKENGSYNISMLGGFCFMLATNLEMLNWVNWLLIRHLRWILIMSGSMFCYQICMLNPVCGMRLGS